MPPLTLITRLYNFTARPLVRNIAKVLTGNLAGNLLNIIALAWLGFALGQANYGLFGYFLNFILFLSQLSDFGLNMTIIKYYRDFATQGRLNEAEALLRRSLWIRMAILAVAIAVCILLARPIVTLGLKRPDLAWLFRLSSLGVIGAALWAYCQSAMQARQQFGLYAVLTAANHALRLVLIGLLVYFSHMDLTVAMLVVIVAPFLGIISSARLWPPVFWTARMTPEVMRRQLAGIFHFSKWIFLSMISTTIIMRLDLFLLGYFSSPEDAGQYTMAFNLAQGIPLITAAVSTVLLPKLAATRRRGEIRRITGIFLKASPALAAAVVCLLLLARWIIPPLKGGMYAPCLPVFDLLVIGSSLSLILNPLSYFCLALERASWLTWMNLAQLFLAAGLDLLLIPHWGALGAGITSLTVRLFTILFLGLAYRKILIIADQ